MPTSYASSDSGSSIIGDLADADDANKGSATSLPAGSHGAAVRKHEKVLSLDELCRLTRFSRKEVRAFYRTLKQECPRGVVSEETLRDVYLRLFPEGNGVQYSRQVFRALDTHGSGGITFTQLLIFLSTISKGTMQERLRWIFRLYDTDGDGVIQPSELFTLIWALREMAGVSSDKTHIDSKKAATESLEEKEQERRRVKLQAEKLFQRWDLNHDGLVTWDEFLTCCLHDENLEASFHFFDSVY